MKTAAIIALAGMATIASAQTATVMLAHDDVDGVINVGETVTWTLSVAFTGGVAATGGNMSITGDNTLGTSFVNATDTNGDTFIDLLDSIFSYSPVNGGNNGGESNGAGIAFVSWTNSLLIAAFDPTKPSDNSNPFVVGTFQFTASAVGTQSYTFGLGAAASAFVSVGASAFSDTAINLGDASLTISSQSLDIVPSPASAALLGLGGLVAIRRRR